MEGSGWRVVDEEGGGCREEESEAVGRGQRKDEEKEGRGCREEEWEPGTVWEIFKGEDGEGEMGEKTEEEEMIVDGFKVGEREKSLSCLAVPLWRS